MAFDDEIPTIDPDVFDAPTLDEDDYARPVAKPRPKAKKKVIKPAVPAKPVLPPGVNPKEVIDFITGQDRRSQQRQQIKQATTGYEASLIQEPQPHKFVPKTRPIRNLNAEEAQFEQGLVEAERRRDLRAYEAKVAGQTAPGRGTQLVNRFLRGHVGSLESMLKGPTLLDPNARTAPSSRFLYQTPEQRRTRIQQWLPVNEYDDSFVMRATEAIGSSVPFMVGGAAGQAVGLPTWMISSVLGAASNAGSTYDDAIANGADEQSARKSAIFGSLIGLTEGLGVGRMGVPAGGGAASFSTPLMKRLLEAARHHGKEGVEEWVQEYGNQVLNNVNAMVLSGYDPKRAVQQGVWDGGSMGFLTGALMSGVTRGSQRILNSFDPDYRQALAEYRQAQAVDKAFKDFLKKTDTGDFRQIRMRQGGKVPTASQFQTGSINAATVPALTDERAEQIVPRRPTPPGRRVPQLTTMRPLWDMTEMTKKPTEPVTPLTDKERARLENLRDIIRAHDASEPWVQATLKWMGGIDKIREEFNTLEAKRVGQPPTPDELGDIWEMLNQAEPNALTTETRDLDSEGKGTTPGGRRRLPNWSDQHVDSLTEENYQARVERKDAFDQLQEAKKNFPKDAYGNTKVSPSMFHSLIIRVESIYENSSDPIGDTQKIAPNDPELTQSLLGYLFAHERMEHSRITMDELMAGPGRRVFGQFDHPDVTPANMTDEEYDLRYEENTLQERAKNAAYAFYPMLKPALGEYLGHHEDNLRKAIYKDEYPEARALIDKAIAEHPSLAPIWEGYVDAIARLEQFNYKSKINDIRHKTRPVSKTRTTTTAEEEYQRREQKELEELNKGITLDKLNKINDRQNIILDGMFEFFKQKEGDKFSELDSHNAILDIISNSTDPLEDLKNLFPGSEKFAQLAEKYVKNVKEQHQLEQELPQVARPSIPNWDDVKTYNRLEEALKEHRAGLSYDERFVREAEQEIIKFERQFGKKYSIAAAKQQSQGTPLMDELGALNKQKHGVLKDLKDLGELSKEVPHWETFLDTLIDDTMSPKQWNMLADAMDRNPKLNSLVNEYVSVVQKRKEIQTGGLAQKPTGLQLNQEQREKEKEHQRLSKLGQDLDDQLWNKTPQDIKDLPDWEHTFIPGRAYYDYHLANNFNLLQQRMQVYEELVDVFAQPQDKELNKKLGGWEKEINEGGLKALKIEKLHKEEAEVTEKMRPVRVTPRGRNVYGNWKFTDDQIDNMSQEEYDTNQELTELHRLKIEIPHKLWPFFREKGWDYFHMLEHLRGSDIHPDMVKVTRLRGIDDPEALRLVEEYAYVIKRLPMLADETTERINQLIDKKAEEEDAFTPEVDVHADDRLLSPEEIAEIVGVGQDIPEGFTADDPEWVEKEEEFFAPGPKKEGEINYRVRYGSTGIEKWEEKKQKAIEEDRRKNDPNDPSNWPFKTDVEMSRKEDVAKNREALVKNLDYDQRIKELEEELERLRKESDRLIIQASDYYKRAGRAVQDNPGPVQFELMRRLYQENNETWDKLHASGARRSEISQELNYLWSLKNNDPYQTKPFVVMRNGEVLQIYPTKEQAEAFKQKMLDFGLKDIVVLDSQNLQSEDLTREIVEKAKSFNFITEAKKMASKADAKLAQLMGDDYVWDNLTDYQQRAYIEIVTKRYKELGGTLTYDPTFAMDDPRYLNPLLLQTDELAFDVMPALHAGQAPYLRAPAWFFRAIGYGDSHGINAHMDQFNDLVSNLRTAHAPKELEDAAYEALMDLKFQSLAEGLSSLSIVDASFSEHQVRGFIEHEVGHAAQKQWHIDPEWSLNHPLVKDVFNRKLPSGKTVGQFLFEDEPDLTSHVRFYRTGREMMTYWIEGRSNLLGMTESEGKQYFKEYVNHLRSIYGQEGVDNFISIMRPNRRVLDAVNESNIEWAVWMSTSPTLTPGPSFEVMHMTEATRKPRFEKWSSLVGKVKEALGINVDAAREILEQNPPASQVEDDRPTDVPSPSVPPGRQPGGGASSVLLKEHVRPEYNQILTRTFIKMLKQGGIDIDPVIEAPFKQVVRALEEGKLQDVDVEALMEEEGLSMEVFSKMMEETASDAGKTLQAYSEIAKFWNRIIDEWEIAEGLEKPIGGDVGPRLYKDPEVMLRIVPISVKVQRAMKGVRNTALGKNFWQRAGNITQKAMLTQFSTFIINTMTSTGQLPLRAVSQGMGAWMYTMMEKGQGSFVNRLHEADRDFVRAMGASMEVLFAMNPWQIVDLFKTGTGKDFAYYQHVVAQLEKEFPDIHKKLFALSGGTETLKVGKRQLSIAQALAGRMNINDPKRDQILKDLEKYQRRLNANASALGQLFVNKPEMVYDFFLQPMQFAEYFLRRPMFVGQLTLELEREGLNLSQLLATNQLEMIPKEAMEKAVNRALEFTYAYMPGTKTGTNYALEQMVEKASMGAIEWLNKWGGPLNALFGEAFMKAAFNGAKFTYEFSPLGGILPFGRIMRNLSPELRDTYTDPITGAKKPMNPTNQEDYDRLAKAMVGTAMYAMTYFLMRAAGGDEWWQIKTGKKSPDGRPIYYDIRRLKPLSTIFQVVDLVERIATGRTTDMDIPAYIGEVVTGIRMYDNQMGGSIIESAADWFRDEPMDKSGAWIRGQDELGKAMAVYITPMLNIRDLLADFIESENVKKDTRGEGVLGPTIDRIPFLRKMLPNLTSPTEPGPIKLSERPRAAQILGEKRVVGENFAGREWRRLGLYNRSFLPRDPDPAINRAQNVAFQNLISNLAEVYENHPGYLKASDAEKLTMWEIVISGEDGLAAAAKEIGELANTDESLRRDMINQSEMGRFQRKSTGYEDLVNKIFGEKKKK